MSDLSKPGEAPVELVEPKKNQLSPDEIEARTNSILEEFRDIFEGVYSREALKTAVADLIVKINNKIGREVTLDETLTKLDASISEKKGEEQILDKRLNEKLQKIERIFFDRLELTLDKFKENAVMIAVCFGLGGAGIGVGIEGFKSIFPSAETQLLIAERENIIKGGVEETLSILGTNSDSNLTIGDFNFRRRTEDIAFSERDFFNGEDFYQLNGSAGEFETFIAIPFKAPSNVIIGIGDFKRELINPTVEEVLSLFELSLLEQEEAEAIKLNQEREDAEATRLSQEQEAADRLTQIEERQNSVLDVLTRLTGNESVTLTSPFELMFEKEGYPGFSFTMIPEKGTGGLTLDDYLSEDKLYMAIGNGGFNYNDIDYEFKLQLEIDVFGENNVDIYFDVIDARGYSDLNQDDFNGQDVSVVLQTMEDYLYGKL